MFPTLNVDVTVRPGRAVVTIAGELDADTVPYVTEATDALALTGRVLVLDFSGVTFMDSSAVHLLCDLRDRALAEDGRLEVRGVSGQGLKLLDVTGTRDLFSPRPAPPTATVSTSAATHAGGRGFVQSPSVRDGGEDWEPVSGEVEQARGLLAGLLLPAPSSAITLEARVERVQQAVVSLAVIGASTHSRLGRLAGDYAVVLTPAMLWHAEGRGGSVPDSRQLDDAEGTIDELRRFLVSLYGLEPGFGHE
ncbi:STAS domain-containing protein [Streptomyces sp. NPDC059957]|uniref:STAS domain-containing protein n=1 Tax=unclassified Streptomyces TaxID=2593676 RepID=UPI003664C87B